MLLSPLSAVLLDESLFFVMLCQCSVTVMMFLQQCVAINVFVTMFLCIICNNMLVTGYVLLVFGEIACNKKTLLLLLLVTITKLAHRPRIASTTKTLISKQMLLSI